VSQEPWVEVRGAVAGPPPDFEGFDIVLRGYDRPQVDAYLTRLEDDLAAALAERDQAVNNLRGLSTQLDQAYRDLRDAHRKMADVRKQIGPGSAPEPVGDELGAALRELAAAHEALAAAEGDRERVSALLEQARRELDSMRQQAERSRLETTNLRSRLDRAVNADRDGPENARLHTELASVRAQLEDAREQLLASGGDTDATRAELVQTSAELMAARDQIAAMQRQLADDDARLAETGNELHRVRAELAAAFESSAAAETANANHDAAVTALRAEHAGVQQDLAAARRLTTASATWPAHSPTGSGGSTSMSRHSQPERPAAPRMSGRWPTAIATLPSTARHSPSGTAGWPNSNMRSPSGTRSSKTRGYGSPTSPPARPAPGSRNSCGTPRTRPPDSGPRP
jgi:DivIVA domain-containing protein